MEPARTPDILVIAAMKEELTEFRHVSAVYPLQRSSGKRDSQYWEHPEFSTHVGFRICGVGKKRAGKDVSSLLKTVRPGTILVIGYSGTLVPTLQVGELVIVEKTVHESLSSSDSISMDMDLIHQCESVFRHHHFAFSKVCAVSADAFVDKREVKDRLQRIFNADCVDMESHSIARIALSEGIPLVMLRTVSDCADETSGLDFSRIPAGKWAFRIYFVCRPWLIPRLHRMRVNADKARRNLSNAVRCYLKNR